MSVEQTSHAHACEGPDPLAGTTKEASTPVRLSLIQCRTIQRLALHGYTALDIVSTAPRALKSIVYRYASKVCDDAFSHGLSSIGSANVTDLSDSDEIDVQYRVQYIERRIDYKDYLDLWA